MLRLRRDQTLGFARAIEQQIAAGIALDLGRDRFRAARDPVDRRMREPGQRHGRRVDVRALPRPFGRHSFSERAARQCERIFRRRPRRLAVEQDRERAIALAGARLFIEALDQRRPRAAPRRFHGIARGRIAERIADHHSSGASTIGSYCLSSNPIRLQVWRMCGGKGAVTSIMPLPLGCGMTRRRAKR